ncbi:MAG: BON domain-containing protein [Burkholderiales bacterium]
MSIRLVIWIASGTLVAAGLAACGDEAPVAKAGKGGDQPMAQSAAQLPVVAESHAPAAPKLDENATLGARVVAALRRDPAVGMLGIDVVGAEGAVTLFGTAPTAGDRERAARVAAGVAGVRSVMNNLVIVSGS